MHRMSGLIACLFTLGLAMPPAFAQTASAPTEVAPGQMRVKALIDRDVYTSDNVEIGEIEDLVLDAQGQVIVAVIEIESRLGFSETYVAVPYAQLQSGTERRVNLPMTRDQVRALPGFRYRD